MLETFSALAEPNRLRIVDLLRKGARPVGAIGEALQLSQPQVSKHLGVLKKARLVEVEARAQQRLYALRGEPLREIHDWLERYRRVWDERMSQLEEIALEIDAKSKTDKTPRRKVKR